MLFSPFYMTMVVEIIRVRFVYDRFAGFMAWYLENMQCKLLPSSNVGSSKKFWKVSLSLSLSLENKKNNMKEMKEKRSRGLVLWGS